MRTWAWKRWGLQNYHQGNDRTFIFRGNGSRGIRGKLPHMNMSTDLFAFHPLILRNTVRCGLILFLALALPAPVATLSATELKQPNIVFILADDLGYADVNAYAARVTGVPAEEQYYETPHIDRLVDAGLVFSRAYAAHLCSPTRASLLTGRNAARIGFTTATPHTARSWYSQDLEPPGEYLAQDAIYWGDNIQTPQALLNGSTLLGLPSGQPGDQGRNEVTFAEALAEYRSMFIGKWHVGGHGSVGYQPDDQGFETVSFFDAGGSEYFNWRPAWNRTRKHYPEMPQDELHWGDAGQETGEEYLTDDLTAQAVRFMRSHAETQPEQPFLVYLCHFAVHTPLQGKKEYVDYFQKKETRGWNGHHDPVYAAMIKSLDDSVGEVMATLADLGLTGNTCVIFMSDNGGVSWVTRRGRVPITSNSPLKGGKAMMFEGGVRVPLIFHFPPAIEGGSWTDVPIDSSDIFPTLLELAGHDLEPYYNDIGIDGRSLVPLFSDSANTAKVYPRDTFYWHYPLNVAPLHPDDHLALTPHSAIQRGNHKLIYDWHGRLYLHDIRRDPFERDNLAETHPELTNELFVQLNDWIDANVAVRYTPALNPDYDPAREVREEPFTDLRRKFLGDERAIRTPDDDPRFQIVRENASQSP